MMEVFSVTNKDLQYLHDQIAESTKVMFDLLVWITREMKKPSPVFQLISTSEKQTETTLCKRDETGE